MAGLVYLALRRAVNVLVAIEGAGEAMSLFPLKESST